MRGPTSLRGSARRQAGIGLVGVMLWITGGLLLVSLGFRLAPAYLEYVTLRSVMDAVSEDDTLRGKGHTDVMSGLSRRLEVNSVSGLPAGTFTVEQKGADRELVADYEVRAHLFANVDVALSFNHRVPLPRQ
jgi:hypothetical protein